MLKILAQDIINDVTLFQTNRKLGQPNYHVRYGLQVREYAQLDNALSNFKSCQTHALEVKGEF